MDVFFSQPENSIFVNQIYIEKLKAQYVKFILSSKDRVIYTYSYLLENKNKLK